MFMATMGEAPGLTRLARGSIWILIVMLAVSAFLLNVRLVNDIDLDNGIIGDEGEMLYTLRAVRLGQPLYRNLSVEPHVLAPYMPLFYLVPGRVARWFETDWIGTLVVGRGYVYALWIGVATMVYALVKQARGCRVAAWMAALFWLVGYLTPEVANSFRPDSAMIFFSLAGVWMYCRAERVEHFACSALLLVVAFLHKHSAVCAVSAILLDAMWHGRWKTVLVMLGTWMVGTVIVIAAAQTLTAGAFGMNVFGSLLGLASWQHAEITLALAVTRGAAVFAGACLAVAMPAVPRLLRTYFVLAVALAVASCVKFGSGPHYYLEAYAIGCVLIGVLVSKWLLGVTTSWAGIRITWLAVAFASCVLALGPLLASARALTGEILHHRANRQQMTEEWEHVSEHLRGMGEPQLIEDVYLAVRSSAEPVLVNASMFASMQRSGRFDDRPLLKQIERGGFTAIVASFALEEDKINRHFPERWLVAMQERYTLAETVVMEQPRRTFLIYKPRRRGDA
jgi:hypothetical protein